MEQIEKTEVKEGTEWTDESTGWTDDKHYELMKDFLKFLNEQSDAYVLREEAALRLCFQLEIEAKGIELDTTKDTIEELWQITRKFVGEFTDKYEMLDCTMGNCGKHTDAIFLRCKGDVIRVMLSTNRHVILPKAHLKIGGIKVYGIDHLMLMKASKYIARESLHELHDIVEIYNTFSDRLDYTTKWILAEALNKVYGNLASFEFVVGCNEGRINEPEKFIEDFKKMYHELGLRG